MHCALTNQRHSKALGFQSQVHDTQVLRHGETEHSQPLDATGCTRGARYRTRKLCTVVELVQILFVDLKLEKVIQR